MNAYLRSRKIGFIGTGSMAQAIIRALVETKTIDPSHIFIHNRSSKKQEKVVQNFGVVGMKNNEEIVDKCDIVFLCTKPQDLSEAISPLAMLFTKGHIVISIAAGVSLKSLKQSLPDVTQIVRAMPNTPVQIRKGVVGYCLTEDAKTAEETVKDLLAPLGHIVAVEEGDAFEAVTVAAAGGVGFVFDLMMYWEDWMVEHGLSVEEARKITVQVFSGASELALKEPNLPLQDLQDSVVSKKGITAAGLESMRELEIERCLRISFEKAAMRDKELGRDYEA